LHLVFLYIRGPFDRVGASTIITGRQQMHLFRKAVVLKHIIMTKKMILYTLTIVIVITTIQSCATYYFRSNYEDVNSFIHETNALLTKPFLKAHLRNGDICILKDTWRVDTAMNTVNGIGTRYDFNRKYIFDGGISIPFDSVAIFETNSKIIDPEGGRITALSILAGVDVAVFLICLTNPKACFGSCPTFYINENDNFHYADAEGFTHAISPSLECSDIDALNNTKLPTRLFSITMKNEALETHCVNDVKLYACPRKNGERIYQSPANDFYRCENNYVLSDARANEGNITTLLRNDDKQERFSLSDENNLKSREEVYINFDSISDSENLGLIISFRQTLMNTYLFYNAMGYMGDEVGDIFALMETNKGIRDKFDTVNKLLGGIDVYSWNELKRKWDFESSLDETGPIAINRQIIPIKNKDFMSKVKLKLVMNKGLWRIDYLALTNIKERVKPIEISPNSILNKGKPDYLALKAINDPGKYLISMPGSEYKFNFILPEQNNDYELFLYSRGYYLEWMRSHWLKDKNLLKLKLMVSKPELYLRGEAENYKRYETIMEQEFWDSKIDTKTFSYHEN